MRALVHVPYDNGIRSEPTFPLLLCNQASTLAANSGCEYSHRESTAKSLTFQAQVAAEVRYEYSLREFAAMGGKEGIPRGTPHLVKRPTCLVP